MKRIIILSAAAALFATSAFAEQTADMSRTIEAKVASAESKATAADNAFAAGDVRAGCKALVAAARDYDKSIDFAIRLADSVNQDYLDTTDLHMNMDRAVRERLQAIVDRRAEIQAVLQQRCVIA